MRKLDFCLCENKGADQLRSSCKADQRLYFRYLDSRIPFLPKAEFSSFYLSSVAVQACLRPTWSETWKTGFLAPWLLSTLVMLSIYEIFQDYDKHYTVNIMTNGKKKQRH